MSTAQYERMTGEPVGRLTLSLAVPAVIGAAQLLVGTFFLAVTVAGYFKTAMPKWMRALTFVVALGFISPDVVSTIAALVGGVVMLFLNFEMARKAQKA